MLSIISIAGLGLILLGWIYETYQTIRDRHCDVKFHFALLYLFGSLFLAYYAYVLNDLIFIILNIAAAFIALVNLYYILFGEKYSQEYKDLLNRKIRNKQNKKLLNKKISNKNKKQRNKNKRISAKHLSTINLSNNKSNNKKPKK